MSYLGSGKHVEDRAVGFGWMFLSGQQSAMVSGDRSILT